MAPHRERFDVLIVGAGIMGSALAYHLARDHRKSVALCERDSPAAGASGKAGGLVSAQCWNDWDMVVVEESRKEYLQLSRLADTGLYEPSGGIRAVGTPEGERSIARTLDRLRSHGIPAEILRPSELAALYPHGNFAGIRQALFTPEDALVLPTDMTQLYYRQAVEAGTRGLPAPVEGTVQRKGDLWSLETAEGEAAAPTLVIAAGAWSKKVLATMGLSAPLAPYLTRACLLKVGNSQRFPYFHDADRDVYLRTFPGGDILAGDGTELVEVDPDRVAPTDNLAFVEHIAEFLEVRFPDWAEAPLSSAWHGVITSTPDRRPLLGPYPGVPGLFLATGFNGFGLMRAGGAMRRLAESMVTGDLAPLGPCSALRFPPPHTPFAPQSGFTLD